MPRLLRGVGFATQRTRSTPRRAGSFLYGGGEAIGRPIRSGGVTGQLVGALIVDASVAPRHRVFMVIDISPENDVIVTLSADSALMCWTLVAKDGFDLQRHQRIQQPAEVRIFQGETYNFEFASSADVVAARIRNPKAAAGVDDVPLQLRVRL